ncbi:DNA cytosine methyltransferase [Xenophilus aerolatus]|nr:DNA (cytosine-5-)-methyltransferase [Xenophilus aerolatus]
MPIPIIDLFAGPGGLGEGFASLKDARGEPVFRLRVSIEKEASAHATLLLRAVYRLLDGTQDERHYYDYVTGAITAEQFRAIPAIAWAFKEARDEAHPFELGKTPETEIDEKIRRALQGNTSWVLIGGPPCQAYSLAGRARRTNDASFSKDVKHFLYREYLRIIRAHRPAIFVMENVKGLLSSKHSGRSMFGRIFEDLSTPHDGVEYELRSFVCDDQGLGLSPQDYLIESERFGIPQTRHRIILLGVRKSGSFIRHDLLEPMRSIGVRDAIWDLPVIRSRISRGDDSHQAWHRAVSSAHKALKGWRSEHARGLAESMREAAANAASVYGTGGAFLKAPASRSTPRAGATATAYRQWVLRPKVGGVLQHEARSHMEADLARYLFAATCAKATGHSPKLPAYPPRLLPAHRNAGISDGAPIPFTDRFRVQCSDDPASTIVSHIAKDGHYYIHYDPMQCRSLTVREAARLQTFPDDYFFEGNRTQQYVQVGNAVPPLLAARLARIVWRIVDQSAGQGSSSRSSSRVAGEAAVV